MVFTLKLQLSPTVNREREGYVLPWKSLPVYPVFLLPLRRVKWTNVSEHRGMGYFFSNKETILGAGQKLGRSWFVHELHKTRGIVFLAPFAPEGIKSDMAAAGNPALQLAGAGLLVPQNQNNNAGLYTPGVIVPRMPTYAFLNNDQLDSIAALLAEQGILWPCDSDVIREYVMNWNSIRPKYIEHPNNANAVT